MRLSTWPGYVPDMAQAVTVNQVLDGHTRLDIECLDRIYLNAYVPISQSSGQVVAFFTQHPGCPIPSPVLFDKIGQRSRRSVASYAEANDIPWAKLTQTDRMIETMRPSVAGQAGRGQVRGHGQTWRWRETPAQIASFWANNTAADTYRGKRNQAGLRGLLTPRDAVAGCYAPGRTRVAR